MSQPLRKLLAMSAALFIAAPGHATDTDRALDRDERAERSERHMQRLPLVIGHRGASGYVP